MVVNFINRFIITEFDLQNTFSKYLEVNKKLVLKWFRIKIKIELHCKILLCKNTLK